MSAEAIFHVTLALRTRLHQALIAAGDPGAVFVGPLDDPDAQGASLILFLYRMSSPTLCNREHRELGTTWIDAPTHSHNRANGDFAAHMRLTPRQVPKTASGGLRSRLRVTRNGTPRTSMEFLLPEGRVADALPPFAWSDLLP